MSLRSRLLAVLIAALSLQAETARYYVVLLRPYPARKDISKGESKRIQSAHMLYIHQMAEDGDLVAAGPCDDKPANVSGIFIFNDVGSLKEARYIAVHDPTVRNRRNTILAYPWDGPPGIGAEYAKLHKLDPKTPENMQAHPIAMVYRGPTWAHDDRTLAAHERYLEKLRMQGKLGAAGSVQTNDDLVELVIFKAAPLEAAQSLLSEDPAVKANVLRIEWHQWLSADHVLPW